MKHQSFCNADDSVNHEIQLTDNSIHKMHERTIEARVISKVYDSKNNALTNVSLQLNEKLSTVIVGPSGAGKTTLLKVLSAGLVPTSGQLIINQQPVHYNDKVRLNAVRRETAFIHQDFGLSLNMTVAQNIACGRLGRTGFWQGLRSVMFPSNAELEKIYQLLQQLGIAETLYKRVSQLSGGEAQRVAIGRALYQEPKVLFADEPVASLDPIRASSLLELLVELCKARRVTLCVSLHNLELASQLFDRLVGLRDGEVLFDKAASSLSSMDIENLYTPQSEDDWYHQQQQSKEQTFG